MRMLLSVVAFLLMTGFTLAAETLSAATALEKAQAGELVLIDIRRPSEWRESGIASIATPLSMHERGFLKGLAEIQSANPGKDVAIICATGGRTAFLQKELAKRGLAEVIDVSEGMYGNGRAPGWLKRGLPIKPYQP